MQSKPPVASTRRSQPGPKSVSESFPVASLIERARALETLDIQLRLALPPALRLQCCLADVRDGRVVFLANSSAWAAKLKLHQSQILAEARRVLGKDFKSFAVKVAPLPSVPPEAPRRKPLSHITAEHLKQAALTLADPELRSLYLQLASLAEDS